VNRRAKPVYMKALPMNKRIFRFIYTELRWIVLAAGLSLFLWMASMTLLDPEQNAPYLRPLFLYNEGVLTNENLVLLNEFDLPENIVVGVRAPASLHNVLAEAEIRPSIDFRAVLAGEVHAADGPIEVTLPISVNLPPGFVLHHISPPEVRLVLDAYVRSIQRINIIEMGEIAPQTELQRVVAQPENVTLSGPRSVVQRIDSVQIPAQLFGLAETTLRTERVRAIDRYGTDITDLLTFENEETTLTVHILPVRRVDIIPHMQGETAPGFVLTHYWTEPAYVYLVGPPERLDNLPALTPTFALNRAIASSSTTFSIEADYMRRGEMELRYMGINLARSQSDYIVLHVAIEPLRERNFAINHGNIGVFGGANYTILTETVHVSIRGAASVIDALTTANITVQLNLHNYGVGTHRIPLDVFLPMGLELVGAPPVLTVRINPATLPPVEMNDADPDTETDPDEPADYDPEYPPDEAPATPPDETADGE